MQQPVGCLEVVRVEIDDVVEGSLVVRVQSASCAKTAINRGRTIMPSFGWLFCDMPVA